MSNEYPTWFIKDYHDGVIHIAQQRFSRLRSNVRVETIRGNESFFDKIGIVEVAPITSRHADTKYTDTPHERRRVTAAPHAVADLFDEADVVRSLNQPGNPYSTAQAQGVARFWDTQVINAAHGSAWTGQEGTTEKDWTTFGTDIANDYLSDGGTIGLTTHKIARSRELLHANEVDDEFHMVIRARQILNLSLEEVVNQQIVGGGLETLPLAFAPAGNMDRNNKMLASTGTIGSYYGFTFHETQLVKVVGNDAEVIAYAKGSIVLGIQQDMRTRITEMPDKNYSTQVHTRVDAGAVRLDEDGVLKVLCDEQ
jgi:hypothetical protein